MLILFLLCILLMGTNSVTITCEGNKRLLYVVRNCQQNCFSETFSINQGEAVLYQSPVCEDNHVRVLQACLEPSPYDQYSLVLKSSSGLPWAAGSWLEIRGEYGNPVFKGSMDGNLEELHALSFYNPIRKNDDWKLTFGVVVGSWTKLDYSDSGWVSVTLGSVSTAVYGTQYFRKYFTGLQSMAAYDLHFFYRYGLIAYVNGEEVVRDNMPEGSVSSTTYASGSYTTESYHSFIRPGHEVEATTCILAVEYHFLKDSPSNICTFNAFLALYAPSILNTPCWVLPTPVTLSIGQYDASEVFNFNGGDGFSTRFSTNPITLQYQLDPSTRAIVNGLQIWPSTNLTQMPRAFHLNSSVDGSIRSKNVILAHDVQYTPNTFATFMGYFNAELVSFYHLTITQSTGQILTLHEVQPMVCALRRPSAVSFPQTSYFFVSDYPIEPVAPTISGFSGCFVLPSLPVGLSLDPATCTISGTPIGTFLNKTFTVSSRPELFTSTVSSSSSSSASISTSNDRDRDIITGVLSIEVDKKSSLGVLVTRTYTADPHEEWYIIYDDLSNKILYEERVGQPHGSAHSTHSFYLHVTTSRLRVHLGSTARSWSAGSLLVLSLPFSEENTQEVLLRASYDPFLNLPSVYYVSTFYPIPRQSQWYYWFGSIPADWTSHNIRDWEKSSMGNFPESPNHIQLYKSQFHLGGVKGVVSYVLSIQYLYGVVVYLNGEEVFRNHIQGALSESKFAIDEFGTLRYRVISTPVGVYDPKNPVQPIYSHRNSRYHSHVQSSHLQDQLREEMNILAIAIIAMNETQTTSYFDCALHALTEDSSRVWDYTVHISDGIEDQGVFGLHHSGYLYVSGTKESLSIMLDNDRREWISGVALHAMYTGMDEAPQAVNISAYCESDKKWTLLKQVDGLRWTQAGQVVYLPVSSSMGYAQYKFEFSNTDKPIPSSSSSRKSIHLNHIDLLSLVVTINTQFLNYADLTLFCNIPMTPSYPSSTQYTEFTIQPELPEGLAIDFYTGVIQGTPEHESSAQHFTVSCMHLGHVMVSVTFTLTVVICDQENSLLSIELLAPQQYGKDRISLSSFQEQETPTTVPQEMVLVVDPLPCCASLLAYAVCLPPSRYTLLYEEKQGTLSEKLVGYRLTLTDQHFVIATGWLQEQPEHTTSRSVHFSTIMPFSMYFTQWKLYPELDCPSAWTASEYDDRFWPLVLPREVGEITQPPTLYFRLTFSLPDQGFYPLLHIRVWYVGGLAVYFNGHRVAKFHLPAVFSHTTFGLGNQSGSLSVFHVVLGAVATLADTNVLAVEMHRPEAGHPLSFDAMGTYEVDSCSTLLDTVRVREVSEEVTGAEALLTGALDPASTFPGYRGSYMEWEVENEDGCFFNQYRVISRVNYSPLSYRLSGKPSPIHIIRMSPTASSSSSNNSNSNNNSNNYINNDHDPFEFGRQWIELHTATSISLIPSQPSIHTVPAGTIAFQTFCWELLQPAWTSHHLLSLQLQYCQSSNLPFCKAQETYPAVAEGEVSASLCEDNYTGYHYRECRDGDLGDVQSEHCRPLPPANLYYNLRNSFHFVRGISVAVEVPRYDGLITDFYLDDGESFPEGLFLDSLTGSIYGMPQTLLEESHYRIFGANSHGVTSVDITISVRQGICPAEQALPESEVGTILWLDCADADRGIGSVLNVCVLGKYDGEWKVIEGTCIPSWVVVMCLLMLLVLVLGISMGVVIQWRRQQAIRRRKSYRYRVVSENNRSNIVV